MKWNGEKAKTMEIYLDNAATTKPLAAVREVMNQTMEADYGNPSSMHRKGMEAERYIKKAREEIASCLKVEQKEIVFTSGGTESNNMALIGTVLANQRLGNHIITTKIEHASVHNPLFFLEESGFSVTYLPVNSYGLLETQTLLSSITEHTILLSIMYVNNEIGSIMPIAELIKAAKEKKEDILVHVDAIQAFGKLKLYPKKLGIDLLSVSAHKIHGPKGAGFLYIKDKIKIKPILYGGEQQRGFRSGTENVPGIAGMAAAVKESYTDFEKKQQHLYELKEYFIEEIQQIEGTIINGIVKEKQLREAVRETIPHIVSVSFLGIRSEVLLHALEAKQIYVSAGSACASNHPQLSGTLQAIGVKKELLDATLRFSFSVNTTKEELSYTIDILKELLPQLRKYTRH